MSDQGAKFDDGKTDWTLLLVMLRKECDEIVAGLEHGARKYNEDPNRPNFQRIEDAERRFRKALLRHTLDAVNGQVIDPDSGVPTLALVAINAMFLRWHQRNGTARSDDGQ